MDDSITIKYGLEPAYKRWFRDQWSKTDRVLAPWIAVFLLACALIYGPRFLLHLTSYLPVNELGNSGASIAAHNIILSIAGAIVMMAAVFTFRKLSQPTAITFDANGMKKTCNALFFSVPGKPLPWSKVTNISLNRPDGSTDIRNYLLSFSGISPEDNFVISLGQISEQRADDYRREHVFKAITKFAHGINVQPEVATVLAPKRALDFTELWLDALAAPPGRDRLLPVDDGAVLDTRYRIVKRLGAGSQGTVYLAQDTENNNETVVLKETILPVYANLIVRKQALESFHQEALALESLNHDRIVKFKRSFVGDHRAYLVLQYIDGTTLSEKVKSGGALAQSDAIKLGQQITEILEALHSNTPPLVHRDLTPDNLMVRKDGNLVLIDFAVAVNDASANDTVEAASNVAGKASYMAPEQFQGKPGTQSDLYSFGCVLFFMLTGEHPEPLASSAPLLHNSNVSEDLNNFVLKATAYSTKDRFASAQEMKKALQSIS